MARGTRDYVSLEIKRISPRFMSCLCNKRAYFCFAGIVLMTLGAKINQHLASAVGH